MMQEQEAERLGADLMGQAEVVMVTTIERDGYPITRAMFNLRRREQFPALAEFFVKTGDPFAAYFATNTSLAKIAHIMRDSRACLYYCKPAEFRGLTIKGDFEIVSDPGIKQVLWQKGWELYYPQGAGDPDYTVFRMKPIVAYYYHQLQFGKINFEPGAKAALS